MAMAPTNGNVRLLGNRIPLLLQRWILSSTVAFLGQAAALLLCPNRSVRLRRQLIAKDVIRPFNRELSCNMSPADLGSHLAGLLSHVLVTD